MNNFRYIGKETRRPDAPDKAAGKAHYIHDLRRPGMLYGKIKFSDHPHARIKHIDTSKAERLNGVRAVITSNNSPEIRLGFLRDNFALKKDKVRQYRDEIAAVAAIDPDIAEEAVELIKVEYEPLPGLFSPQEAMKKGSPLIHETDAPGPPQNRQPGLTAIPSRVGRFGCRKADSQVRGRRRVFNSAGSAVLPGNCRMHS